MPTFEFTIGSAAPVEGELISHVRDSGTIISIVSVPDGAIATGRVTIRGSFIERTRPSWT